MEDDLMLHEGDPCPGCGLTLGVGCFTPSVCAPAQIEKVRKEFEGAITEIGANKTLVARDEYNSGWNAGADMAIKFIRSYIDGRGLFQS